MDDKLNKIVAHFYLTQPKKYNYLQNKRNNDINNAIRQRGVEVANY